MRRRAAIESVPYAFFTMAYGNGFLQVFLPSIEKDRCIDGQPLNMPAFPNPGSLDAELYGRPRMKVEDLTGREPVRGEAVPAVFRFDQISLRPPEGDI